MWVVTGDGAAPPGGPFDRVIVTASLWALPAPLVAALADDGLLVAPLRLNGIELVLALRRAGDVLRGTGGLPCGFMPLRERAGEAGAERDRPWRWPLGGRRRVGGRRPRRRGPRRARPAARDAPAAGGGGPARLQEGMHALDALLWLGLQGDPLVSLIAAARRGRARPAWSVALDILPASLLVIELGPDVRQGRAGAPARERGRAARLRGRDGRVARRRHARPRRARARPSRPRATARSSSLPFHGPDGAATLVRGAHRWSLRYRAAELTRGHRAAASPLLRGLHYCAARSSVGGT